MEDTHIESTRRHNVTATKWAKMFIYKLVRVWSRGNACELMAGVSIGEVTLGLYVLAILLESILSTCLEMGRDAHGHTT